MATLEHVEPVARLIAAITQQTLVLMQIQAALDKPQLGLLVTTPGTVRVYCNRDRCPGALWYTVPNGEPVPLDAKAIRGYVRDLRFEQVERRGKPTWKLYTFIDCGGSSYELESGHESVFSKGLLSAIASMEPSRLSQPLSVGVAPGDDESVLLCRVWGPDNAPIFARWDEGADWRAIAQRAIAVVKQSA
jgi:hypothetical protein